jgi:crossover junction endodeoxyribonuclease RuvC
MNVLGVDPGVSGALALYAPRSALRTFDIPIFKVKRGNRQASECDAVALADLIDNLRPIDIAIVESVWAMTGDNIASLATLMQVQGVVLGILAAFDIPTETVAPQVWKRAMHVPMGGGMSEAVRKDASRRRASQLLPGFRAQWALKKDHGRAEATLLAVYGAGLRLAPVPFLAAVA